MDDLLPEVEGLHHKRVLIVLAAVRSLRSGGTASDIQKACRGVPVSTTTVRRVLVLLLHLGHVTRQGSEAAYWWQAK